MYQSKLPITDEELYQLRKSGKSYMQIAAEISKPGRLIDWRMVQRRCKKIYGQRGEAEPQLRTGPKMYIHRTELPLDIIFQMREEGYSYDKIAQYITEKGIPVSAETICHRCKEIYSSKGKEEPCIHRRIEEPIDEQIYQLRKQGYLYKEILQYFREKGIQVSYGTIQARCERIYAEKGEPKEKIKRESQRSTYKLGISVEEIWRLRDAGMSCHEIQRHFAKQGKKMSVNAIARRCKERESLENLEKTVQELFRENREYETLVEQYEMRTDEGEQRDE